MVKRCCVFDEKYLVSLRETKVDMVVWMVNYIQTEGLKGQDEIDAYTFQNNYPAAVLQNRHLMPFS